MLTNLLIVLTVNAALVIGLETPAAAQFSNTTTAAPTVPKAAATAIAETADNTEFNKDAQSKESVKSSGASISEEPAQTESTEKSTAPPASSQGREVRVIQARLKGSLCVSCMLQLQNKLRELDGVKDARIIRPAKNGGAVVNEPRFAQIEIFYYPNKQNLKKLKRWVERYDFALRNERDMEFTADYKPIPDPSEKGL